MIRITITAVLSVLCFCAAQAQTAQDSIAITQAQWHTVSLENGANSSYAQIDIFDSKQSISVIRYPQRKFSTFIVALDREARITSELGEAADAYMAINAGYFNVKTFQSTVFLRNDGKTQEPATAPAELMRVNGVVALRGKHGQKMDIFFCDTNSYRKVERRYRSALASGPVLVKDSKQIVYDSEHGFYTGHHPRALIGKNGKGEVVMVVIDGRFKEQGEGMTINQTAFIARMLGLIDAINLDGGGSATLWSAQEGVLNHPSDNHKFDHAGERAVPNCIAAKARKRK